jgi:DNA-binding transcriptional MerR regulator
MSAVTGYTIGQLASSAGVRTSTVRFYERAGLLKPDGRTGGNYRHYGEPALARLRFIRSAQATGFSLEDVRELLSLTGSDEIPCDDVLTLTRQRLAQVRRKIGELRRVEKGLARSLAGCCSGQGPDLCDQVTRLRGPGARPCKGSGPCRETKSAARA